MSADTPSEGSSLPVSGGSASDPGLPPATNSAPGSETPHAAGLDDAAADRLAASLPATEKLSIWPEPIAATATIAGPPAGIGTAKAGMPASMRGLLITLAVAFLLALAVIVVLLLGRGPASGVVGQAPVQATPHPTSSQTAPSPTPPSPTPSQPSAEASPVAVAPPAEDEPVEAVEPAPPPAVPAPPVKVPLTEGIVNFDARTEGGATIASACAAVLPKAAKQQDWVLLRFSWTTVGMIDGGEIQVNGTYGGSSDLQGLEANSSVLFDLDCFTDGGAVKTTTYQLLMSTGTTRHAVQITLSGTGQTQEMTRLY